MNRRELLGLMGSGLLASSLPKVATASSLPKISPAPSKNNHLIKTGIQALDSLIGGFKPGEVIVLGGRPSMGKTSLSIDLANYLVTQGSTVAYFSMEMDKEEVTTKVLSSLAKIELKELENASLSDEQWKNLIHAAAQTADSNLFIDDEYGLSIPHMISKLERMKEKHQKCDVAFVDYYQLMRYPEEYVVALKSYARRTKTTFVLLSQVSRAPEYRKDRRPRVWDLSRTTELQKHADKVILMYRPYYYDTDEDRHHLELIVGQNKNGPTGVAGFDWVRA